MNSASTDLTSSSFLNTKYGKLHYISCGFQGDPLILIIHGSGPQNSSKEYEFFLFEYGARVSFSRRFFIVAIDCPGYGRSEGLKSIVRTFPLQLIEEIYACLNYTKAFALFGHSQGGSSIFNAVFLKPEITEILIQERPVCGDIKRFKGFPVPCLLIYDIEDDGHPVSQGKLLHKNLKYSDLVLFRKSKEPYWISDFLWDTVLEFVEKIERGPQNVRARSLVRESSTTLTNLNELVNGDLFRKIRTHHSEERRQPSPQKGEKSKYEVTDANSKAKKPIKPGPAKNLKKTPPNREPQKKLETGKEADTIHELKEEEDTKSVLFEEKINPVKQEKPNSLEEEQVCKEKKIQSKIEYEEEEEKKHEIEEKITQVPKENQENLEANYICGICLELLYEPVTLNCRHSFCLICLKDMLIYQSKCPLCVRPVPEGFVAGVKTINNELIQEMQCKLPEGTFDERMKKGKQQKSLIDKRQMLFMAFGHEFKEIKLKPTISQSQSQKKSFNWKLFVEQINFKNKNLIKHVEFDINYMVVGSKPLKVEKPPFILEGKGGFNFTPCIRITWNSSMKEKPYETFHRVCFDGVTGDGKQVKKFMIKLN